MYVSICIGYMTFSHKYDPFFRMSYIYICPSDKDITTEDVWPIQSGSRPGLPFVLQHRVVHTADARQLPENAVPLVTPVFGMAPRYPNVGHSPGPHGFYLVDHQLYPRWFQWDFSRVNLLMTRVKKSTYDSWDDPSSRCLILEKDWSSPRRANHQGESEQKKHQFGSIDWLWTFNSIQL